MVKKLIAMYVSWGRYKNLKPGWYKMKLFYVELLKHTIMYLVYLPVLLLYMVSVPFIFIGKKLDKFWRGF